MSIKGKLLGAVSSALLLGSCGGGGGGGSVGDNPVTVTPPPAPTPDPPLPPPAATVLSIAGTYPLLAEIRFYPSGYTFNGAGSASVAGGKDGFYPSQLPIGINTFGFRPANYGSVDKLAIGIDPAGSFLTSAQAPADSLVISPLSHLLMGTNTQARLKAQLGISGSLFGLAGDRDLKSFSVVEGLRSTTPEVVADSERLVAHHLRVQMLNGVVNTWSNYEQDPVGLITFQPRNVGSETPTLTTYLAQAPAEFLYTNSRMSALLRTLPTYSRTFRPDVVDAAAHLVNAYAATIPVRIGSREQAARFMIGIKGYLIPEILQLLTDNSAEAANRALAVTSGTMLAQTERYTEQLPFDVNDSFFTSPDFYTLAAGSSKLVDATDIGSNGDGPFTDNDIHLRPTVNGQGFFRGNSTVTSVTVPTVNSAQVTAVLNPDGTVLIRPAPGFVGVTWFDYTARHERGDIETGRVYVRVRA